MNNSQKLIVFCLLIISFSSCSVVKDTQIAKVPGSTIVDHKTFIYALPQTVINIRLEVTKTIIKKGPYAEYAQKYLDLASVPLKDSETWDITDVKIWPIVEADQEQYYAITYKTFPENLNQLFSLSNHGVILDFASAWEKNLNTVVPVVSDNGVLFDPTITKEISKEQVDTFYKTIITDTSLVRIPVFKKKIQIKNTEDLAKEMAHELIKTRKRKLKLMRGEYDFHPDGKALEVMIKEMDKQEKVYSAMFSGIRLTEKQYFTYTIVPQPNKLSKDLCYFSVDEGILNAQTQGLSVISAQIKDIKESSIPAVKPEKAKNALYVRFPINATVIIKMDDEKIAEAILPVYQFSPVQVMPLK